MEIIIIAVISIAPYLTNKSERTMLYEIINDVYIKKHKIINYRVILYSLHTHAHTHTCIHIHTCTCTNTRAHRRN